MDFDTLSLTGKLLIATPSMGDPRFERSVIYLCQHDRNGAMGIVVNKPIPQLRFRDLLGQLGIPVGDGGDAAGDAEDDGPKARRLPDIRVHFGGPVEGGRGFVLHSSDYESEGGTLRVDKEVSMTATLDILRQIAAGDGPKSSMLALGYAGWGAGQLDGEIAQGAWLVAPSETRIVWGRANEHKWVSALRIIGVDPQSLSSSAGHA